MANGQLARASLVCQTSAGSRSQDTEGRTARLSARSGQRNSLVLRRAFFERGTCGRDEPVANRRAPAVAAALGSGSRSDGHGSASREQDLSEAIVRYQDHYARNGQRINHRHLKANGCEAALDNPTDLRSSNDSTHRFKDPADPSIEEPGELAEISPMQTLKEPMVAKVRHVWSLGRLAGRWKVPTPQTGFRGFSGWHSQKFPGNGLTDGMSSAGASNRYAQKKSNLFSCGRR